MTVDTVTEPGNGPRGSCHAACDIFTGADQHRLWQLIYRLLIGKCDFLDSHQWEDSKALCLYIERIWAHIYFLSSELF